MTGIEDPSTVPLASENLTNFPPHLKVLSNFTNKTLEWQFTNQQLSRLLIPPDFAQCNCSRTEPMRLLHSTSYSLHPISVHPISPSKNNNQLTAVLRAAEDFVASCLRGALPPVDLRAVCLVRAITNRQSMRVTVTTYSQIHTSKRHSLYTGAPRHARDWLASTNGKPTQPLPRLINKPRGALAGHPVTTVNLSSYSQQLNTYRHVWTWKRWQGSGKGWC